MEALVRLYFTYRVNGWAPSMAWKLAAQEARARK